MLRVLAKDALTLLFRQALALGVLDLSVGAWIVASDKAEHIDEDLRQAVVDLFRQ